jgi:hypothetical protein
MIAWRVDKGSIDSNTAHDTRTSGGRSGGLSAVVRFSALKCSTQARCTAATVADMQIVSALFVENFELRKAAGGATRIDLTGAMFSMAAPTPVPVSIDPHLVGLIFCPENEAGSGVFEVVFRTGIEEDSEQLARNVSPFTVEPGKFTYRLVRGELQFDSYRQIFAHCRIDRGPWHLVPFTLLPPA